MTARNVFMPLLKISGRSAFKVFWFGLEWKSKWRPPTLVLDPALAGLEVQVVEGKVVLEKGDHHLEIILQKTSP